MESQHAPVTRSASPRGKIPVLVLCDDTWHPGAMVGLCAQDLSGLRITADFDFFDYAGRPSQ